MKARSISDATSQDAPASVPRGRAKTITLWVLQALLALEFAITGFLKLTGTQASVDMFTEVGAGQWLRYVVGALEIAGAIGVLVPLLAGLAASGLVALMAGVIVTELFILEDGPLTSVIAGVMAAVVAWGRWSRTRELAAKLRRAA